jgi:chromosome segregation ATPase
MLRFCAYDGQFVSVMQATVKDPNVEDEYKIECPCCKRGMNLPEVEVFQAAMKDLSDDFALILSDPNAQEQYRTLKATYQNMRKAVESKVDDLRDFRRMTGEAGDLDKEIKRLQDDISHYNATLKDQTEKRDEAQSEVNELRELVDTIRRWSDDAGRIAEKKLQIYQKKLDLNATVTDSTRDLKTVDRQITELKEEKEVLSNKILRLNKEMSDINHRISEVSTQVSADYIFESVYAPPI